MELPTKPLKAKGTHSKVQYNLRIDQEMLNWLKTQGQAYERPVNYLINHAIKQMKSEIENAKA